MCLWEIWSLLLRFAHPKERGVIEDIDYQHPRGLDRKLMRTLASSDWVQQHQDLLLLGPTGISFDDYSDPSECSIRIAAILRLDGLLATDNRCCLHE